MYIYPKEENDLLLEERYKTFSSHITVTRIPEKLKNPYNYIKAMETKKLFGSMKVASLELVYHNWYDSKKTVLAEIGLKGRDI